MAEDISAPQSTSSTPDFETPGSRRLAPRPRRWLPKVLIGFGVLVAAIAILEWLEWPFLRGPLESTLKKTLKRDVTVGPNFGVRFIGPLRLHTDVFVIGPSPEGPTLNGQSPALIHAQGLRLSIPYSTIWSLVHNDDAAKGTGERARQPIRINVLEVANLDANLIRDAQGKANWTFGSGEKKDTGPLRVPEFRRLQIVRGNIVLDDALTRLKANTTVHTLDEAQTTADGRAATTGRLQADARGTYRDQPLTAQFRSNGLLPIAGSSAETPAVPIHLEVRAGGSALDFDGTARNITELGSLDGKFRVSGPSLSAVGDALGVTLPSTASFVMDGRATKEGAVWSADVRELSIGTSRLNGKFRYDPTLGVPKLTGQLGGSRLSMPDLGPAVGARPKPRGAHSVKTANHGHAGLKSAPEASDSSGKTEKKHLAPLETNREGATATPASARVLPQREFDIPSLAAMDADITVALDEFDLGTEQLEKLSPLKAHITLEKQMLAFSDIVAGAASGQVEGVISLDARKQTPLWKMDLRWSGVQLERFIKPRDVADSSKKSGYISGTFGGRARLNGDGRSTARVLASLDGNVQMWVRNGRISHFLVEVLGLDIAQALGMWVRGDDSLPMSCAIAAVDVRKGNAKPQVAVIETTDSTLTGTGAVSLAEERLDLTFRARPKDMSPISLRSPVVIAGTFSNPEVKLEKTSIAMRLVAAAALAAVTPPAALLALVDLGDPEKRACESAIQRAQNATPPSSPAPPRKSGKSEKR